MGEQKTVGVIRIQVSPDHRGPWVIEHLPFKQLSRPNDLTTDFFTHVPDVCEYMDWNIHSWPHRLLVDLGEMDPHQTAEERAVCHGPFFMYKCCECPENGDHWANKNFEKCQNVPVIYGNVWIFSLKAPVPTFDKDEELQYSDLDSDVAKHVFNRIGTSYDKIFEWLAKQ